MFKEKVHNLLTSLGRNKLGRAREKNVLNHEIIKALKLDLDT